jgi:hypothetical protein
MLFPSPNVLMGCSRIMNGDFAASLCCRGTGNARKWQVASSMIAKHGHDGHSDSLSFFASREASRWMVRRSMPRMVAAEVLF